MQKEKNIHKVSKKWIAGAVLLLMIMLVFGIHVWKDYRDTLMDNQINQLKVTTDILSKNMESSIQEYEDDLDFFDGLKNTEDAKEIFRSYIKKKEVFVEDLFWEKPDGTFLGSVSGKQYKDGIQIAQMSDEKSMYQMKGEHTKQEKYLVVKKLLDDGNNLCLVVNEEKY